MEKVRTRITSKHKGKTASEILETARFSIMYDKTAHITHEDYRCCILYGQVHNSILLIEDYLGDVARLECDEHAKKLLQWFDDGCESLLMAKLVADDMQNHTSYATGLSTGIYDDALIVHTRGLKDLYASIPSIDEGTPAHTAIANYLKGLGMVGLFALSIGDINHISDMAALEIYSRRPKS